MVDKRQLDEVLLHEDARTYPARVAADKVSFAADDSLTIFFLPSTGAVAILPQMIPPSPATTLRAGRNRWSCSAIKCGMFPSNSRQAYAA
jgi:hypothetical protein